MTDMDVIVPTCAVCKKKAIHIEEYVETAKESYNTSNPSDFMIYRWVQSEEGTYNPSKGLFTCTPCYIAIGMPANDINDPSGPWQPQDWITDPRRPERD